MAAVLHSVSSLEESLDSGTTQTWTWSVAVPTGAKIILPFVNYPGAPPVTLVDNQGTGNTYAVDVDVIQTENRADIWSCQNFVSGGTPLVITMTFAGSGNYNTGQGMAWTGLESGNSLDRVGEVGGSNTVTASAANTVAECLVVYCGVINGSYADAGLGISTPGFSLLWRQNNSSSTEGGQAAYRITSAIETSTVTSTNTVGLVMNQVIATYRVASGTPTTPGTGENRAGGRQALAGAKATGVGGQERAGGRLASSSTKAGAAGAAGRAGGRESAPSTFTPTRAAAERAGGRQAAPAVFGAPGGGSSRAGGRQEVAGVIVPGTQFTGWSRAGGRQAVSSTKAASLSGSAGAGGREELASAKAAAATAVERAGGRVAGQAAKGLTLSASSTAGGRQANTASTAPTVLASASSTAGGRQAVTGEAHDNPQPDGPTSTGSGSPARPRKKRGEEFDPWNETERARAKRDENDTDPAQSETPEPQSATTAHPVRQRARDNVAAPLLGLAPVGLVDGAAVLLEEPALEVLLEALPGVGGVLEVLPDPRLEAERLALELAEDDAEALAVIEAALAW